MSAKEWAKKWRIGEQQARAMLREGVSAGAVAVKKFRVMRQGVARPIPHYAAK